MYIFYLFTNKIKRSKKKEKDVRRGKGGKGIAATGGDGYWWLVAGGCKIKILNFRV